IDGVHQTIADELRRITPTQTLPHQGGGLLPMNNLRSNELGLPRINEVDAQICEMTGIASGARALALRDNRRPCPSGSAPDLFHGRAPADATPGSHRPLASRRTVPCGGKTSMDALSAYADRGLFPIPIGRKEAGRTVICGSTLGLN